MKIGYFVSVVSRLRGYERNVSGHIQIPLHALQLLGERGHEVHLITNEFGDDRVLPWCMPDNAHVHYVLDSRRRLGSLEKKRPPVEGVYPLRFLRQVRQIKGIAEKHGFDIMHFSGQPRTVQLGAIVKLVGLRVPTVGSLFGPLTRGGFRSGFLLRRAGPIITATNFVAETCSLYGVKPHVLRHGLVRDFRQEWMAEREGAAGGTGSEAVRKHRVLFWRDLTRWQGADVAIAAFDTLASEFPHLTFTFAVRPQLKETPGLDELQQKHANVQVYRFPYPPGVSLAGLIHEAVCAVMPFRRFTMQPQLAIAESLAAGVPVVASDVESASDLVSHEQSGYLVPPGDVEATTAALRLLLHDPHQAEVMGRAAEEEMAAKWNWDRYVDQIEQLYESLITAPRASAL